VTGYRRILVDVRPTAVTRASDPLHARGGRSVTVEGAYHPPPIESLAPDYLRRILRLEAMSGNASGADKSWVHQAHAAAVRHLNSARRR